MEDPDRKKLEHIIDIIIPAGKNGEPSASQSRAPVYVSTVLQDNTDKSELHDFVHKLSHLQDVNENTLQSQELENPELFKSLVELVYEAYYGDPEIVKKLDLPGPPQPGGHMMKPFDKTLLEQVLR